MQFDISDFLKKSHVVEGNLKGIGAQSQVASGGVGSLTSAFAAGGVAGIAFGTAMKAVSVGLGVIKTAADLAFEGLKHGVKLFAEYEQAQIGFGTLLGGDDKAADFMKDLDKFALGTPFSSDFSREAANQLLTAKVRVEELIPTMRLLGDISQGNAEKFRNLARAYSQTLTAKKLTGGDSLQYVNAQINIVDALATSMKKTSTEILAMREKGLISAKDVRNALIDLGNVSFADGMKRQTETLTGQWSELTETLDVEFREIGKAFKEPLKDMIRAAKEFAEAVTPYVREGVGSVAGLAEKVTKGIGGGEVKPLDVFGNTTDVARDIVAMHQRQLYKLLLGRDPTRAESLAKPSSIGHKSSGTGELLAGMLMKSLSPQDSKLEKQVDTFRKKVLPELKFGASKAMGFARDIFGMGDGSARSVARGFGAVGDRFRLGDSAITERRPTGGIVAGSSEAMSAVIRNMFKDKDKGVAEKQLKVLVAIEKAATKTAGEIGDAIRGLGAGVINSFGG